MLQLQPYRYQKEPRLAPRLSRFRLAVELQDDAPPSNCTAEADIHPSIQITL
jgi:hypothetical protein